MPYILCILVIPVCLKNKRIDKAKTKREQTNKRIGKAKTKREQTNKNSVVKGLREISAYSPAEKTFIFIYLTFYTCSIFSYQKFKNS